MVSCLPICLGIPILKLLTWLLESDPLFQFAYLFQDDRSCYNSIWLQRLFEVLAKRNGLEISDLYLTLYLLEFREIELSP